MKKKWVIISFVLFAVSVILALVTILSSKQKTEKVPEFVLLYADNQAENYPTTLGDVQFANLVYKKTDGRIKIDVKYGAELGSEADVINQMKYGGIAFARVSCTQLAERIPEMNVLNLPYLYDDSEHMWRVLEGEIGDDFLNKTSDYNLVGLSWYDAGARSFYSTEKPITCVGDMNGMNIRVQESSMMADMVTALGAKPVEVVFSDVYAALEKGVVDGAENNWPSYVSMNHYKLAKYYTLDEHMRVPEMQVCSEVVWNMLDESDQKIIKECAKESAVYERRVWNDRERKSVENAVNNGTEVIKLTPEEKKKFRDAMSGVYEKYCGEYMDTINKIIEY